MSSDRQVRVTDHATGRAGERVQVFELERASARVTAEVEAAIAAGRVACRKPRSLHPFGRRPRGGPGRRFVWVEDGSRTYVVKRARDYRGRPVLLVLTVLTPLDRDDELEDVA